MSALNVLTESNLSNKLISGNLSYQEDSILGSSPLNDEEQLLKVFPRSILSESALAEEERIEKEITRVFGDLNSNCFNEIACINEGKVKNRVQVNQVNSDLTPSVSEDCFDDTQKGMSQLTLDILINETKETLPITNIINEEEATSDNTTDDSSTHPIEEEDSIIPEGSNDNEPKETDKLINNLGKTKETKELSNTTGLNAKEPDVVDEENSHISNTPTEQEQAKQETTQLEELDTTSVSHNSDTIIKKTVTECDIVTIDFIAECIADRTITKYKHFELCIKDNWKLKPDKEPEDLAELTSRAKGGDVFKPVQDMELLKQGLKDLLIEL
ncbi:hypothetical protein P4679_22790 [Priestia megaterium]|uniref:hypothetical protein n=1 Tax=Priestia megaterium TaxID=1404 RepID=UPI002E233EDA|nr:hypothetical protein [Priestia megaterium]